jgi:hypothetical protein
MRSQISAFPPVVIQSICTDWTKASRGGIDASARNRTPEAFALPARAFSFSENTYLLHEIFYGERDHFQHPTEKLQQRERTDPFGHDCFNLSLHEYTLHVTFEWERSQGVPRRRDFLRTEFCLQDQQWMRIIYNLRIAQDYGWIYQKHVFNIGFLLPSSPKTFLEEAPTHTYTDMAQLW